MNRTFLITGGNSGLGYQCAKNIALQSKHNSVVIASRNVEKSDAATKQLVLETQNAGVYSLPLD
ncbi:MAG: KR domain-containing protein, partial [Tannerella sp.]|nr:KR domain-containing protein [Tannerella sp.]